MNPNLTLFNGRFTIDKGVRTGTRGINDCRDLPGGGLEWRSVCYVEGDTPFNIVWERAINPLDMNSRCEVETIAHFPSPVFINCSQRSE